MQSETFPKGSCKHVAKGFLVVGKIGVDCHAVGLVGNVEVFVRMQHLGGCFGKGWRLQALVGGKLHFVPQFHLIAHGNALAICQNVPIVLEALHFRGGKPLHLKILLYGFASKCGFYVKSDFHTTILPQLQDFCNHKQSFCLFADVGIFRTKTTFLFSSVDVAFGKLNVTKTARKIFAKYIGCNKPFC